MQRFVRKNWFTAVERAFRHAADGSGNNFFPNAEALFMTPTAMHTAAQPLAAAPPHGSGQTKG